ncbi:hypothetical protein bcere0019_20700 [Bacillus cereus Rock3-28]|nr:hypothetical protein bcere0019_20700 [Bacillus cereus Rock3-28]
MFSICNSFHLNQICIIFFIHKYEKSSHYLLMRRLFMNASKTFND